MDVPTVDPKRLAPPDPAALNPRSVETVSEMLVQAKNPVMLADMLGQNPVAVERAAELAEILAMPV